MVVDARSAEHVQKAVKWAADHDIPLSVKSTGHDFQGRSTRADTLNIWVHNMKGVTYVENWTSGCQGS
jgi:FAD/FMN-containing dehydrogenase